VLEFPEAFSLPALWFWRFVLKFAFDSIGMVKPAWSTSHDRTGTFDTFR
jgi:hypothetical protein